LIFLITNQKYQLVPISNNIEKLKIIQDTSNMLKHFIIYDSGVAIVNMIRIEYG